PASALHTPSFPTRRSSDLLGAGRNTFLGAAFGFVVDEAANQTHVSLHVSIPARVLARFALRSVPDERRPSPQALPGSGPSHSATDRKSTRLNSSHVKISYA